MGKHREWRKIAKKMRRKRIRQKLAKERDEILKKEQEMKEKSPRYQAWLLAVEELELFEQEEEERLSLERNLQWFRDEEIAQQKWKEHQEHIAKVKKEREKQELLIRKEWEEEQKKLQQAEEEENRKKEEKKKLEEELMKQIDDFIHKGGEVPLAISVSHETNPNKPLCPFFSKTGACRFGDRCSRNHPRPGISKVLLIPNFYSHFGIEQALYDECDSDLLLEYEDSETYQHFRDFFEDVLPEFEKFGRVVQFKVCRNFEPHLRGNVYVEYASSRDAVAAYRAFQGRWYGGKQLNVEFTCVASWKSALCGLFFKGQCPKGKNCNFLHVFCNPGKAFARADKDLHRKQPSRKRRSRSPTNSPSRSSYKRNWRWSESPEVEINRSRNGDSELAEEKEPNSTRSSKRSERGERRHRSKSQSRASREKRKSRSKERVKENKKRKHIDDRKTDVDDNSLTSHSHRKKHRHKKSRSKSKER